MWTLPVWLDTLLVLFTLVLLIIKFPEIHHWFTSRPEEFQKNLLYSMLTGSGLGFILGIYANLMKKSLFINTFWHLIIGIPVGIASYAFFIEHLMNHTLTKNDMLYVSFFSGMYLIVFIIAAGIISLIVDWKVKASKKEA